MRHYHILNDKRHILTKDTENNVMVYDVLKVGKFKECSSMSKGNVPYNCLELFIGTRDVGEMAHICSVQMGRKANKEKKVKMYG